MHTRIRTSPSPDTSPLRKSSPSISLLRSPDDPPCFFRSSSGAHLTNPPPAHIHLLKKPGGSVFTAAILAALLVPQAAHASLLHGETLDAVANGVSWVAIILVPLVGITVFWLVHILPEKIAHNKRHPQTRAIQCLCLLSLCFGGLLWPLAWLWAYTKPVLHKLAYGTDVDDSHDHHDDAKGHEKEASEVEALRARVAELEAKLNTKGGNI